MMFPAPAAHLTSLCSKFEEANKDNAELRARYDAADNKYKEDQEAALAALRQVRGQRLAR